MYLPGMKGKTLKLGAHSRTSIVRIVHQIRFTNQAKITLLYESQSTCKNVMMHPMIMINLITSSWYIVIFIDYASLCIMDATINW